MAAKTNREARSEVRAQVLVRVREATERLLADGVPFGNLSVEGIARETGIAKSTFYFHFVDLGDFLVEATKAIQDDFLGAADDLWFANEFPIDLEMLEAILVTIVSAYRRHEHLLGAVVDASASNGDVREVYLGALQHFRDGTRRHLEQGAATGALPKGLNPELTADWLVWTFERGLHQMVRGSAEAEGERHARTLARLIWHGIYAPGEKATV